jgi:hypothetical protein
MSNVADSKKSSKSRHTQSASAVFQVGRQHQTYRSPGTTRRDWSFRPDLAAMADFKKEVQ